VVWVYRQTKGFHLFVYMLHRTSHIYIISLDVVVTLR